jgi:hypothetical protein
VFRSTVRFALLLAAWDHVPAQPAQGMGSGARTAPRRSHALASAPAPPGLTFRDVAAEWGITAPNFYGGLKTKKYILEMTGNGAAVIDYDNDGRADVILVNGGRLDGASRPSTVYRNLGAGRFADETRNSGLNTDGWAQGVCAGDYDNDGFTDLFVTRYGSSQLWKNERGRFRNATGASGLSTPGETFFSGCTFLDYDKDGRLDLFVTSYAAFSLKNAGLTAKTPPCNWLGLNVFCGPRGAETGRQFLFHNEGGGKFRDVSDAAGVRTEGVHYGLGTVAGDFDDDGWPDIYVACDSTPSLLFRNNRDGTFRESAVEAGVAYGENGEELGGMGVAVFDSDNDGRLDIVRTNFIGETPSLYRNMGELSFADETMARGLAVNTGLVSWGVQAVDFDQDGWRDLAVASGHIYPELGAAKSAEPFLQPRSIYWNARNGVFADVSAAAGEAILSPRCSRGMAAGDLDGDGAPELVVVNQSAAPMVLKSVTAARGNWILLHLEGTRSNRSAIGARVTVVAKGRRQMAEVQSGGSYLSQSDLRLHFGLGDAATVESIEVRWPSGAMQIISAAAVNQVLKITESQR